LIAGHRGRAGTVVVLTAVLGAAAVACSGGATTPSSTLGPVPDGVAARLGVEVTQGREQYADREVQLRVTNESDETLTLLGGSLHSDGFGPSRPTKEGRTVTLRPGATRGVFVELGEARCSGPEQGAAETAAASATIALARGGGDDLGPATDLAVGQVADPDGHLARNHTTDCAAAAVAAGATLSVDPDVPVEKRGGELSALVTLRVEAVDGGPEVTLDRIAGTTLMSNPDPADGVSGWVGQDLADRWPGVVELVVVPARCDVHAVAEDKRGTFLPVTATVDGDVQEPVYVPMPDTARADFYAYVADYCDWPD